MRGSVGTLRLISLETVSALGAVCAVTLSGSGSSHLTADVDCGYYVVKESMFLMGA